jgi:hypothetical protein
MFFPVAHTRITEMIKCNITCSKIPTLLKYIWKWITLIILHKTMYPITLLITTFIYQIVFQIQSILNLVEATYLYFDQFSGY